MFNPIATGYLTDIITLLIHCKQELLPLNLSLTVLILLSQVSLLLKDSFIDSFPGRDRPFIKVNKILIQILASVSDISHWNREAYQFLLLLWVLQLFVDTQLFSVLSDSRLSSFENGRR